MEDSRIVQMYWDRDERAIDESNVKYGGYCTAIACNILGNHEIIDSHREDFYPREVDPIFAQQLGEDARITIIYRTLQHEWYLNRNLTEISQVLQSEPVYVECSSPMEYAYYYIEEGQVRQGTTAWRNYPSFDGLFGLTQERIDALLAGLTYEEYFVIEYA